MSLLRFVFVVAALVFGTFGALGQNAPGDIEVTDPDILQTCRDIHRTPLVQDPAARVTPQGGIVFDCSLVNANGATSAQVLPDEVCERLTGSRQWYRGDGTQVFCVGGGTQADLVEVPCPQPSDEPMLPEDVTRACQKLNRTGNVGVEELEVTTAGPRISCRVSNANGFTVSAIPPDYVCEVKTGRRYWCNSETTVYCRGDDYVETPNPGPNPILLNQPSKVKPLSPGGASEIPEAERAPRDLAYCVPDPQTGEIVLKVVKMRPNAPGRTITFDPELVTCGGGEEAPEDACERLTGDGGWYLSANGFVTSNGLTMPAEYVVVCDTPGPRQRLALANFTRFCDARGFPLANTGAMAGLQPYCHTGAPGSEVFFAPEEACLFLYGTSGFARVDPLYWCKP